jgi:phenylalanyl-tRNA synthetase beta chain
MNSEITEKTGTVLFESAKFKGYSIRLTSKKLGMATEASQRFVRGSTIEGTAFALERACHLVELLGAGKVDRGIIDVNGGNLETPEASCQAGARELVVVALNVKAERMSEILNGLYIPTELKTAF